MGRLAGDPFDVLDHGVAEMADRLRHQYRPLVLRSEHDQFGQAFGHPGDHIAEIDALLTFDALTHQFVDVAVQAITHTVRSIKAKCGPRRPNASVADHRAGSCRFLPNVPFVLTYVLTMTTWKIARSA